MPKAVPAFVEKAQDRRKRSDDRSGHRGARSKDPLLPKIPKASQDQATALSKLQQDVITPWLVGPITSQSYPTVAERLHGEIVAFTSWVSPTPTEDKATQLIVTSISNSLAAHFSAYGAAIKITPFGSVDNGLAFPNSDLNLEFSLDYRGTDEYSLPIRFVHRVLTDAGLSTSKRGFCTKSCCGDGTSFQSIQFSLVPELGSRTVTLTRVNSSEHVGSAQEVKSLLGRLPALKPLFLVLKSFLLHRYLGGGANALTCYALLKLCARFLESNPCDRPAEYLKNPFASKSLGTLLGDFFYYFGFYNVDAVSEALRVPHFFMDGRSRIHSSRSDLTDHIQRCFQHAWTHLNTKADGDRNILGPVVAVTHQMVKLRASIIDIVCSGHLEKIANSFPVSQDKSSQAGSSKPQPLPHRPPPASAATRKENHPGHAQSKNAAGSRGEQQLMSLPREKRGKRLRSAKHVKAAEEAARVAKEASTLTADAINYQFGKMGL